MRRCFGWAMPKGRDQCRASTASTLLNEMGRWHPDAIERQLAHMEEKDVRRAYMHAAEFWSERVADHLDQRRYGSPVEGRIKPFVVSQG
jgi:hypothetical protein